jgi:hypothetical protein
METSDIDELLKDATHISFLARMRIIYLIFPNEYESENTYNSLLNLFDDSELTIQLVRKEDRINLYLGTPTQFIGVEGLEEKEVEGNTLADLMKFEEEFIKSGLFTADEYPVEFYIVNLSFNIHTHESRIDSNLHFKDQQYKKLNIKGIEIL